MNITEEHRQEHDRNIAHIEQEVKEQPIISAIASPTELKELYKDSVVPGFLQGIDYLSSKYSRMRRVRGDGNCFYRAVLYSYLECLISLRSNKPSVFATEQARIVELFTASKNDLIAIGYDEFAFETFYDNCLLISTLFQKNNCLNASLALMQTIIPGQLRRRAEEYIPFIMDDCFIDMATYCQQEVEPMGKECEHVHIAALIEYIRIPVTIEYLDGRPFDVANGMNAVKFGEHVTDSAITVHLLYRPGHYDILYE